LLSGRERGFLPRNAGAANQDMHELSIAEHLVREVLAALHAHDVRQVDAVELEIGALELIDTEALCLAWEVAAEGTPAAGAAVRVTETEARAVCRNCGAEFVPEVGCYVCPKCGAANAEIVAGRGVVLQTLECS